MTGTGAPTSSATAEMMSGTARAPGHHGPELDRLVVAYDGVGGDEGVAADHQHGLGDDRQLAQDLLHPTVAGHVDLAPWISEDDLHRCPASSAGTPARA